MICYEHEAQKRNYTFLGIYFLNTYIYTIVVHKRGSIWVGERKITIFIFVGRQNNRETTNIKRQETTVADYSSAPPESHILVFISINTTLGQLYQIDLRGEKLM